LVSTCFRSLICSASSCICTWTYQGSGTVAVTCFTHSSFILLFSSLQLVPHKVLIQQGGVAALAEPRCGQHFALCAGLSGLC
jgi:hypothetical protein